MGIYWANIAPMNYVIRERKKETFQFVCLNFFLIIFMYYDNGLYILLIYLMIIFGYSRNLNNYSNISSFLKNYHKFLFT